MMQPGDFGITKKGAFFSLRHAAVIIILGFILLTTMGYLNGFKALSVDYNWIAFYIIISVPIQEIVFRGIIQKKLYRFGKWASILSTSIIFAAIHFQNSILIILTLAAGLCWGYSFSKYPNLAGPIISHILLGLYLFLFII